MAYHRHNAAQNFGVQLLVGTPQIKGRLFAKHRLGQQHLHTIGDFLLGQPQLHIKIHRVDVQRTADVEGGSQCSFVQAVNILGQHP